LKKIILYSDGACSGNPGPGGYGTVLLFTAKNKIHRKELSGGEKSTTNNRMELTAAIKGLQALKEPCEVELFSDSKYVVDAVNKGWAKRWQANNWQRNKTDKALNVDLWEVLLDLLQQHKVTCNWVKGHADNEENERCDLLAKQAIAELKQ